MNAKLEQYCNNNRLEVIGNVGYGTYNGYEMNIAYYALDNVTPIVSRAEEYKEKKFDVVTARGVANLTMLLELVCNLVKKDGYFVAMKGSKYLEELDAAKNAIKLLGYELVKKVEYKLPTEDSSRCNLYFKKVKNHDDKYPRNFGTMKKKPL